MRQGDTLEIVELSDGDVILRRADSDEDAIITIAFSREALAFFGRSKVEICKAMIGAGVKMASQLTHETFETLDIEDEQDHGEDNHSEGNHSEDNSSVELSRRVLH